MIMDEQMKKELVRLNYNRTKTMILIIFLFILYTIIINTIGRLYIYPTEIEFYSEYIGFYFALFIVNIIATYTFNSKKIIDFYENYNRMKWAAIAYNVIVLVLILAITTIDAQRLGHIVVFEVIFLIAAVLYFVKPTYIIPSALPICIYMIIIVLNSAKIEYTYSLIICGNIMFITTTGIIASKIIYKNKCHAIQQKLLLQEKNMINEDLMAQLRAANEEMQLLMMRDPLTNVWNRRAFDEFIRKTAQKSCNSTWTFFMLDIDYFKQFNDYYGHQRGDEILIQVASTLQKMANVKGDFVVRWGGEEFMYVTNEDRDLTATIIIEAIQLLAIPHERSKIAPYVTVSVGGYSTKINKDTDITDVYNFADKALYEAKEQGRNCVQFC